MPANIVAVLQPRIRYYASVSVASEGELRPHDGRSLLDTFTEPIFAPERSGMAVGHGPHRPVSNRASPQTKPSASPDAAAGIFPKCSRDAKRANSALRCAATGGFTSWGSYSIGRRTRFVIFSAVDQPQLLSLTPRHPQSPSSPCTPGAACVKRS